MLEKLKKSWNELKAAPVGERFQQMYEARSRARSGVAGRVLYMGAGTLIFCAGLVLMPAPGPGLAVLAIGAALLAGESKIVAKSLDRFELLIRRLVRRSRRVWKWSR